MAEVAVTLLDVDEEQARRIMLVDNRTNDLAGYDEQLLAELLSELPDLAGTGYGPADLDALLVELGEPEIELAEDDPPALADEPRTKPGDLYVLGRHRLVCGDAREPSAYARLLEGEQPELVFTDPPYGVDYEGKTARRLTLAGDERDGLEHLLSESFAASDSVLAPGARIYVAHPAGALSLTFGAAFVGQDWRLHQTLVWVKDQIVLGRSDYHYKHESILYGHKRGAGRTGRGARGWFGDNSQVSVLEVPRPKASREHPTMKPPELIAVENSSAAGDVVLDPFAGSGSTLVACERTHRRARLIELDPRYCDVIVERYERLTGQTAEQL